MEMKEVLNRDAKNLLVYQYYDEKAGHRKPPVAPPKSPNFLNSNNTPKKSRSPALGGTAMNNSGPVRVRSASTGRDKRSELQARYWALLFGNLQRAVNEIYQTCECYENISSCQEAILVLENYVRDFKALSEWFKVSWDYESRPLQQRPQSLAWEVRKSNPGPRVRAKSLSSPSPNSGKSSPCICNFNSGKSSPCCGNIDALSPRKSIRASDLLCKSGAMRVSVRELFASSKQKHQQQQLQQQQKQHQQQHQQHFFEDSVAIGASNITEVKSPISLCEDQPQTVSVVELFGKKHQYAQTDLEDDHLTLADVREKMFRAEQERLEGENIFIVEEKQNYIEFFEPVVALEQKESTSIPITESPMEEKSEEISIVAPTAVEMTVQKLNAMEDALLTSDAQKPATPESTLLKPVEDLPSTKLESDVPKEPVEPNEDAFKKPIVSTTQQAGALKYSSVLNRPPVARFTAPAKPASTATTATTTKVSSGGSVPAKPNSNSFRPIAPNARRTSQPINNPSRTTRSSAGVAPLKNIPVRPATKTENYVYGPPNNVASRLSIRSRTMVEMNGNMSVNNTAKRNTISNSSRTQQQQQQQHQQQQQKLQQQQRLINSRKSSREDIGSSTSTLKASTEAIISTPKINNAHHQDERHSEPKQLPSELNDGWLTVKNRRRSSMHWSNRFNLPTGYASLPTLSLYNEEEQKPKQQAPKQQQQQRTKPLKSLPNNVNSSKEKATAIAPNSKSQRKQSLPTQNQKNAAEKPTKTSSRPEIKNAKAKVNSLPAQRKHLNKLPESQSEKTATNPTKKPPSEPSRTTIKRQKSDITGLKMTSLHEEYMRSEKQTYRRKNLAVSAIGLASIKNDSKEGSLDPSSTETIIEGSNAVVTTTNGDSSSTNVTPSDCSEQQKIDIKIQTNPDFSKTIGDLYESIAAMSRLYRNGEVDRNDALASCCEEDDESYAALTNEMLDCDENQRLLVEEQESLERQIRELESTEIDVDTETDETDCEAALDHDDNDDDDDDVDIAKLEFNSNNLNDSTVVFVSINEEASSDADTDSMSLELRYSALLSEISWNEREAALATLQAYVARHPGRAQELHQKLSSPSRRRSLHETLRKYQAKQARAQEKRESLQKERAIKIQQLLTRVEDVKLARLQIIEDKRQKMEDRLQRAAENREQYLRQKVEKAHDEDKKLKEINFIKNIEAQNKRLELIESTKDAEVRLQDLEQERQKRLEEKAAKEAAVERRRQELEKERLRKLEKMHETRLEKEHRIGKMQEQKERERQALAREKARDREERLLALQQQQQHTTEELQRKILQKQQESARRHEENMEHIRQRALELTIPSRNQDDTIDANGELASGGTDGEHSSTISDSNNREHSRAFKKKLKKLKQRMTQLAEEYLSKEQQPLPAHMKRDSQVPKYVNLIAKGGGAQGLERSLVQLLRLIAKAQVVDFQCFLMLDGLGVVAQNVIVKSMEEETEISKRSLILAVQLFRNSCSVCPQIARHAILGNSVCSLFDALSHSLQIPEEKSPQHPVELSTELMLASTVALSPSFSKKHPPKVLERLPDLISYAVITGLIENLARRCMKIRESVESQKSVILSLLATLGLLTKFIDVCQPGPTDQTRFLSVAKSTELFGSVSMLYASVVPMGECIPPRTISLAAATFNLLVSMAVLDLSTFQETLTIEALALKYLDVITILLKYCGNKETILKNSETQAMIIDLVATIGFYCANNRKHQDLLVSDQCSIIIKNLTKLPEQFQVVVYPCLVTVTYKNQDARNVIARDFNLDFLDEYHKSEKGKKNHLVSLLKT